MKYLIVIIILLIQLSSCFNKTHDRNLIEGELISKVNLKIGKISLDSFYLDSTSTSFIGTLHVYHDNIIMVDNQFCWVFRFDRNGKLISRNIGQGDGESELPCRKIDAYVLLPNGEHMFFGPSWDVYIFDSNFIKIADYRIDWHPRGNKEYVGLHPDPSDPIMYSATFGLQQIRADKKNVYLPLYSQHNLFNPIVETYSKQARVIGEMDFKTGDVTKIFGRLSPIYQQNKSVRIFSYLHYDLIDDDEMAITYPVDSVIYIVSRNFSLKRKFGSAGKSMSMNYQVIKEYNKISSTWSKESKSKGYYTSIDFVKQRNLLFRSYQKSGISLVDGLQIYKFDELIADVDIPKKCKIIGYIKPYFYISKGPDEISGNTKLFRFQLPL